MASDDSVRLDYKARQFILRALRYQVSFWEKQTEDELGEDAFADLQNDLLYAEGLLSALEEQFSQKPDENAALRGQTN